jgi:inhibitor of KinA
VLLAFRRLVNLVPRNGLSLIGVDSSNARQLLKFAKSRVQTFGTADDADWQAHDLVVSGATTRFGVRRHGSPFGEFDVPLLGAYNVRNALAAIAVATEVGISAERAAEALRLFAGVKRRLEVIGTADGVTIYDDFAHHPTAVAETLTGLRAAGKGRIWAVFEPRSASSCRRVFHRARLPQCTPGAGAPFRSPAGRCAQEPRPIGARGCVARRHHFGDRSRASNGRPGRADVERWLRRHPSEAPASACRVTSSFRIVAAGDSVLIAELEERIDPTVNARAIAIAAGIDRAKLPGVRDVVTTYRSVAVYFDPLRTNYERLLQAIEAEAQAEFGGGVAVGEPVRVPVCYGGEFGPDLDAVAAFGNITAEEVVTIHSSAIYRVFMLGFVPGFAYMGTVDSRIAAPRHATPRVRVPLGSVGVAGVQTGIYPAETPGGWQLIGRTPLKPFDAGRAEPFLFRAGDHVRFFAITPEEFDRIARGEAEHSASKAIRPARGISAAAEKTGPAKGVTRRSKRPRPASGGGAA